METSELLQECKLQLEYLNEKFGQTGTTNSLLAKIDKKLNQPRGHSKRELLLHRMSDWLMINTPLDVEEIVDFCEYFKSR
ncbi:MAG: hypothetical protein PHF25_07015 [Candidatus Margulisbacteria bacterium]|nr:hypothetical protein [Candidatus Margulisiibacteriota bacterium]